MSAAVCGCHGQAHAVGRSPSAIYDPVHQGRGDAYGRFQESGDIQLAEDGFDCAEDSLGRSTAEGARLATAGALCLAVPNTMMLVCAKPCLCTSSKSCWALLVASRMHPCDADLPNRPVALVP